MSKLTAADVDRIRRTPGRAVGLFLTDRCPVMCGHCSVDAKPDSPSISNFALFEALLAGICTQKEVELVAITGGEPFVERRGLTLAVRQLKSAGKKIVLFTSGVWAKADCPSWIADVLRSVDCVFLSTDAYHADRVNDRIFASALRAVIDETPWVVVQVLNVPEMVDRVMDIVTQVAGTGFQDILDISLIEPLPYGRASQLFQLDKIYRGDKLGRCGILASPVIRYDGRVTACCNEQVIMGHGPSRLADTAKDEKDVSRIMNGFRDDDLCGVISRIGVGTLTEHPLYVDMAAKKYQNICEACWELQSRASPIGFPADPLIRAMSLFLGGVRDE